jgi:hypothetical protein
MAREGIVLKPIGLAIVALVSLHVAPAAIR